MSLISSRILGGGSSDKLLHFFCDIVTMTRCFASPLRQSKINAKKCCTTVLNRTSCCLQVGSNLPWINSNTLNRWWELYCAVIMLETYNVKISAMPLHVRPMLGAKLSLCLHGQKISWQRGFVSFLMREIVIVSRDSSVDDLYSIPQNKIHRFVALLFISCSPQSLYF